MKFRHQSMIRAELEKLNHLFTGINCPVFLVGGVGLAVRTGHFYRNHKDFDLAIFSEDFEDLSVYLQSKGYQTVQRRFTTKISKDLNVDIYKRIPTIREQTQARSKIITKILYMNRARFFRIRSRLDMMDLLLFEKTNQGVIAVGYETNIPWKDFYPLEKLSEDSMINLPNINYKKYFKPKTDRQLDDLEKVGL